MKITESQLRRIIQEEKCKLEESSTDMSYNDRLNKTGRLNKMKTDISVELGDILDGYFDEKMSNMSFPEVRYLLRAAVDNWIDIRERDPDWNAL